MGNGLLLLKDEREELVESDPARVVLGMFLNSYHLMLALVTML